MSPSNQKPQPPNGRPATPQSAGKSQAQPPQSGAPSKHVPSPILTLWEVLAEPIPQGEQRWYRCEYILSDQEGRSGLASATIVRDADGVAFVRVVLLGEVETSDEISEPIDIAYFLGMDTPTQEEWHRAAPDEP